MDQKHLDWGFLGRQGREGYLGGLGYLGGPGLAWGHQSEWQVTGWTWGI